MPFIFDTVWDLIKLAEYLTQRDDIDPKKIGITGISLGGMHAWFAAAADTRYSVVVPLIGVQVLNKIAATMRPILPCMSEYEDGFVIQKTCQCFVCCRVLDGQ
jgi:dienelactone hydrolase